MIPKIIHYCWFGGKPLPPLAVKCIESWIKFFPDYEIKEWNESNFDVDMIPYTSEAYRLKKYAFVSDYARFYVLYKYGGLYFDTDVEVIKNMGDIVDRGPFMGMEAGHSSTSSSAGMIAPGLGLGVNPGLGLYKEMLDMYANKHYATWMGRSTETVVYAMTRLIDHRNSISIGNGIYKNDEIYLYEPDYFCPLNYYTGELIITERTVCIHHYMASWVQNSSSFFNKVKLHLNYIYVRFLSTIGVKSK